MGKGSEMLEFMFIGGLVGVGIYSVYTIYCLGQAVTNKLVGNYEIVNSHDSSRETEETVEDFKKKHPDLLLKEEKEN